ncbi:hypothetical protein WA026_005849 [Henosepilachna vigintioctopunctata]|uniref:Cytochrome P450 n=1 Tax=Henosepilachna vigintioctopunctata TaxID=420089 RepID=A0AAW1U330_9CUCU
MIFAACLIALLSIFILKWFISLEKSEGITKGLLDIPRAGGIPIAGNIGDFFCSEVEQWKRSRERARKYYPIYRIQVFGSNIVCLLHPDDIQIILGDLKQTSKGEIHDFLRSLAGNGLVNSEGDIWHKRRKWITKSFHFSVLRNYVEIFNNGVKRCVNRLKKEVNLPTDVLMHSKNLMLRIVNESIVGEPTNVEDEELEQYVGGVQTILKILHYNSTRPYMSWLYRSVSMKDEVETALKNISNFVTKVLAGKDLTKPVEDVEQRWKLLDLLLGAPNLFQGQEIKDEVNTFLLGGHDGTSTALSYALMAMANYTKYQEDIYQEMKTNTVDMENPTYEELKSMEFLDRFLKECLRLYPPAPYIVRQLNSDVVTKTGYTLPTGTLLLIQIFDVQRNADVFPEPDSFNPDRFLADNVRDRHPFGYIPFSAGPRNCIAQKYSMLKLKACVCGILKYFKLEPISLVREMVFVPDSILKTEKDIKVKFVLRNP